MLNRTKALCLGQRIENNETRLRQRMQEETD